VVDEVTLRAVAFDAVVEDTTLRALNKQKLKVNTGNTYNLYM